MIQRKDYLSVLKEVKTLAARLHESIEDGSFYKLPFRKRHALVKRIKKLYSRLAGAGFSIDLKKLFAATSLSASLAFLGNSCLPPEPQPPDPRFHFIGANPFGLSPYMYGVYNVLPSFADIDSDGDADLFLHLHIDGAPFSVVQYFENKDISDHDKEMSYPYFEPGDIVPVELDDIPVTGLSVVKGDSNGDFHVFVGMYDNGYSYGNIFYCKYDSELEEYIDQQTDPFNLHLPEETGDNGFFSPFLIDLDGDNDIDAFAGADYGSIYYFKGVKTDNQPFLFTLDEVINVGDIYNYIIPALADIDRDGDLDLFIGSEENIPYTYYSRIYYFENKGSNNNPDFQKPARQPDFITDINTLHEYYYYLSPAFVDADGDGDLDLFVGYADEDDGDGYGGVLYFENSDID
jgi:hypothetical protein